MKAEMLENPLFRALSILYFCARYSFGLSPELDTARTMFSLSPIFKKDLHHLEMLSLRFIVVVFETIFIIISCC